MNLGGYVCVSPGMTSGTSSAGKARMARHHSGRASTRCSTALPSHTGNAFVLGSAYPRLSRISSSGRRRGRAKPGGALQTGGRQVMPNPNADDRHLVPRRICFDLSRLVRRPYAGSRGFRKDEDDWLKLEQFRRALLRIVEGEDAWRSQDAQGRVWLKSQRGSHTQNSRRQVCIDGLSGLMGRLARLP